LVEGNVREPNMTKKVLGILAGIVLASVTISAQSPDLESLENHATAPPKSSAVPPLEKYPFTEALKKLQSGDASAQRPTAVPPLVLGPVPPVGSRSKEVPRDFVPKRDVALSPTAQGAVGVSRQWQDGQNIPAPGKDGRVVYVYGAGMPVMVCSPLRICVIELQPGEKIVGEPQIGDSVRWEISPAVAGSGEDAMPLIVVKPLQSGLDTTMVIPTDRRAYYLRLQSKPEDYLARVAFAYPEDQGQQWRQYAQQQESSVRQHKEEQQQAKPTRVLPDVVDAIYWDYQIKGGDLTMRPTRILDDGVKTYIQMPLATQRTEAPVLVVIGSDGVEMVNYRVKGDLYIVDRLFNRAALIVGVGKHARKVQITRKSAVGAPEKLIPGKQTEAKGDSQ
jgi:type IV secretion system protein VirB9